MISFELCCTDLKNILLIESFVLNLTSGSCVFKGMVEKWLLQVEKLMLSSVRDVIHKGVIDYEKVHNASLFRMRILF